MYSNETLKKLNCNHDIDKYFENKFVKDDYCPSCLESIDDVEQHNQAQSE